MELRHLRYFVAVAENLNFTKAAAKLHLAQPSLTRQIHNLEEEIGVRLLSRSKSHVALTEEGRCFLTDARRILALATESILAVQRLSRGETGELNIAYLPNFDFELLPETLRAFRQAFPHIALNLFDMSPAEQFRALEARKIDLGFVGLPPPAGSGLYWECITRHRTIAVLPSKHRLARKRQVSLTDLENMFFVGMSERTHPGFRDWLNRTCQQVGFTPRVLQDAELEAALMTFVAEGLGVSLAREHIKKLPHPGVVFRPLAPPIYGDYCIAWNRANEMRAVRQYIEIVKSFTALAH
ncbi:MAG TPA: LysR substrate-binding domain-containing protein [Candidatus Limnocylindrales bacterium]|jgi:DNA-binding transcriptional LysR family regulator|nr:LysR substrate-binding domain-containing protein [Candidatus Limnocylindrales bacterium]